MTLDLSFNRLSGTLPEAWGMSNTDAAGNTSTGAPLNNLILSNNMLTGTPRGA